MIDRTINVTDATRGGDFTLRILFDDGIVQTIDFGPFLRHSHHPAVRVFLSPPRFQSFRIEYGDLVCLHQGEQPHPPLASGADELHTHSVVFEDKDRIVVYNSGTAGLCKE